jgi:anti-sigma regulatory factor (Ser/Thr protein kinase)/biotin operon repressor
VGRAEVDQIVSDLILAQGGFSSGEVAAKAGISRQAVNRYLRAAIARGELVLAGKGRGARYRAARQVFNAHLPTAGLGEDRVWDDARLMFPRLGSFANASSTLRYAFTEMLNNAIDHSGSAEVDVNLEVAAAEDRAHFVVSDEGIGVFENVRARLGLADRLAALQEISKGKVSTQPDRHSGEGIFFTSKVARTFELAANGLMWIVDNVRDEQTIVAAPARPGTVVRFELGLSTETTLESVFERYTHDFEFDTSRIVVKLFEHGVRFVSRSEAKRLLAGLEKFRLVVLDFGGVEGVGQGFADEVFRVWVKQHPETRLAAERMSPPVEFMVERARRAATGAA